MKYMILHKNRLLKGLIVLFLIAMLLFPTASYQGASTGLLLWFHNVLPNLLPFIIISNLMVRLNITKKISKLFYPILGKIFHVSCEGCYPIIIGFLSGIPMGAKSTADLVAENKIHKREGQFLFSMCNNASPMFIIGYIAITQLKLPQLKYVLFVIIYGSAILSAIIFRYFYHHFTQKTSVHTTEAVTLNNQNKSIAAKRFTFDVLDGSIMNGFEIVTRIGGYIILFSIMAQIIKEIGPDTGFLKAFLMGIFEITTGINQICKADLETGTKIVLVAVLTSFGGFSGIAQTKSVLGDSRLSINSYIVVKLTSALIALILAFIYITFFQY